ncbi:MAG: hypothetical protein L0206_24190 [Actinobacteria bacterium]|nr:hypothetical protein [Actinomycetota bacterium]
MELRELHSEAELRADRPSIRCLPRLVLLAASLSVAPFSEADATCNVIPRATREFRGALGAANRPFASPGDFVRVRVRPAVCDGASTGFVDLDPDGDRADDYVVTVLFDPPDAGAPRNAVVLAEDCTSPAMTAELATCDTTLGAGTVSCVDVDGGAGASGLVVPDDENLSFRFPDTDDRVGTAIDDQTLTGPAKVVVTDVNAALPCDRATTRCANATGVVACVDELFEIDGTCRTAVSNIDSIFPNFTALPPPNSYQAMCATAGTPCTGTATEVHFTVDQAGNVLVPIDWSGVRVFSDGLPVARVVRLDTSLQAFAAGPGPIVVPGKGFIASYSPQGIRLPPIFTPSAPQALDPLALLGAVDGPRGVSRIARRSPVFEECTGGTSLGLPCTQDADCPGASATCGQAACEGGVNVGAPCDEDADCPGSECGGSLFDFSDRLVSGVGPVVIPSLEYTAQAGSLVPLDGLFETPDLFAFAVGERFDNTDRNDDGDNLDLVMTLGDRAVGDVFLPTLSAVVRERRPPFSFTAAVAENDVIAYLESEPAEGNTDFSTDGDVADTILRVFRAEPAGRVDLLQGQNLCADAEPLIGDRPLAFSDGLLFFRTPEWACAARVREKVSITESGAESDGVVPVSGQSAMFQVLSGDGSLALWESGFPNNRDLFLRDRSAPPSTTRITVPLSGSQTNAEINRGHLSADGSTVVFDSEASNLVAGTPADGVRRVFVHDVASGTTTLLGLPDPEGACSTSAVSGQGCNQVQSVSADGRFVVFNSDATNLPDADGSVRDYLHDRMLATTERVEVNENNVTGVHGGGAVSADGTRVAFDSGANLDPPDQPGVDVFVRDRSAGTTTRVNVASDGTQGAFSTARSPSISPDGRFVCFLSDDSSLVPGDTNGASDFFVHDLETGFTERVNVSSEGFQADGDDLSNECSLSLDGRFAAFCSEATNLVAGDTNGENDVFLHDRVTGITQRMSLPNLFGDECEPVSVSWDGQTVSFGNFFSGTFVRAPNSLDPKGQNLNADGDLRDTHLRVIDATGVSQIPTLLGPAQEVAVEGGSVAFLRPEADGGADLDADSDVVDDVVHYWANRQVGAPLNLSRAAVAVALSSSWIAALVPETGQGAADRNGDGDAADTVVELNPVASVGSGSWTAPSPPQAAESVDVVGNVVAFLTDEASQGATGTHLNSDGDKVDLVLQLWNAGSSTLTNVGEAAEEFVLGENLVAFRTNEASEGATDLNLDGDTLDDVLQVRDLVTNQLVNSRQAVIPCDLEACDPRIPYRVSGDVVTFLTLEADQGTQGTDLDEDGDTDDLVVQTFNVRKAIELAAAQPTGLAAAQSTQVAAASATATLASVGSGLCLEGGEPCSTDTDCALGACFVPPGDCIESLAGTTCSCGATGCSGCNFGAGEFCEPVGTCHVNRGRCASQADCTAPAVCRDAAQDLVSLPGAVAPQPDGEQVFWSIGTRLCLEDVGSSCSAPEDCPPSQQCGESGVCQINHGTCTTDDDCPAVATCTAGLFTFTAAAADADADGVADPFDNCPDLSNADQMDGDADGIGDACDRATCGDGVQTYEEGCDDGNRDGLDGCSATCTSEGIACSNGVDSDGDGLVDFPSDPGCTSASDTSERQAGRICDDGINNDTKDGLVDFPSDPGCRDPSGIKEDPLCDDDLDNDNDGKIDWDGVDTNGDGDFTDPGEVPPDTYCDQGWKNREKARCGLGFELVLGLAVLVSLRGRRRIPSR